MRRPLVGLLLCLALAASAACGGSDKPAAPQTGTLIFKIDPVTCTGSGTVEYFIDGTSKGQYSASAGSQQAFVVSAGPHTAGARETTAGGYVWPTQQVTVPANGSWTATMSC